MVDNKKSDLKGIDLFIEVIEKAYVGDKFQYGGKTFRLTPTLVKPSDFHKKIGNTQTSYESLLNALDPTFKTLAASEVYRAKTGWTAKVVNGHKSHKIRQITSGEEVFLLPHLSKQPTVGIDTSGFQGSIDRVMVVCSIPDAEGAYLWLEKHLKLPKDLDKNEFHWVQLNPSYRHLLLDNFERVLAVCCDFLFVVKSNVFSNRKGKMDTIFTNLIDGCFSGFESVSGQAEFRAGLRQRFFRAVNGVEVHCDNDFAPLTPEKVVQLLVKTLAKQRRSYFENYTPVYTKLRSHESKAIQIADIIAGVVKNKIDNKELNTLRPLPFDARKLGGYSNNLPKVYFWIAGEE